jgi:hypothetical protein
MNKDDKARNELMHQMEETEAPKTPVTTSARTEINNLLAEIEKLNRIIALYEDDATYNGYYALNRLYNEQINYLKGIELKDLISAEGKEYERAMKVADTLHDRLLAVNKLKIELNPSDDEEADVKGRVARRKIISPESMATTDKKSEA